MDFAALVSGGKDSLYAAYLMCEQGWSLKGFVSVVPEKPYSYMFHSINLDVVGYQAQAAKVPNRRISVSGEKEREVDEFSEQLSHVMRDWGLDSFVTGAVRSEYQRTRFDSVCERVGAKSFSPLWHKDETRLLREYFERGFRFMLSGTYTLGLDSKWVGRTLEMDDLEKLVDLSKRYGFSPIGEGGEYESLVTRCPLFYTELEVKGQVRQKGYVSEYLVESVQLSGAGNQ
ncbi:MAG: diphthine--ammonia ligase [Thermoprotei archaeon]